jgi:hypothetical protein
VLHQDCSQLSLEALARQYGIDLQQGTLTDEQLEAVVAGKQPLNTDALFPESPFRNLK